MSLGQDLALMPVIAIVGAVMAIIGLALFLWPLLVVCALIALCLPSTWRRSK